MALPVISKPRQYLYAPVGPDGIRPPTPPKVEAPKAGGSISDFSLPVLTNPFKDNNIAVNNIATNNIGTDSPYFTYAMRAEVSKLRGPSALEQDLERRSALMFDYNNPDQVNSYADIIMRTAVSLGGAVKGINTWGEAFTQLNNDLNNIISDGYVKPFQHGLREGEWDILLNNQLVNFSESIDLIDNIYKAFVMNDGLKDWNKGVEGVKSAVIDRKNYDWDTGNKVRDLALEMLTPTNIVLAVSTLGVGSLGKAAGKEAAEEVGTKVLKSFARNYKGNVGDAILKMPYRLTELQTKALTEIATHKMNLRLLQGLNHARRGVDLFDSIGPKLAIKSTIGIPWTALKGAYRMTDHTARYLMHAVETLVTPADSFISTFKKFPELEFVVNNIGEATRVVGEEVPAGIPYYVLRSAATRESKALKKLRSTFSKTTPSDKLIREYMDVVRSRTGELPGYDVAAKHLITAKYNDMFKAVDTFINETTQGLYKNFDDYNAFVTKLSEVSNIADEVKELNLVVKQLEVDRVVQETLKYQEPLTDSVKSLRNLVDKLENNTLAEYDVIHKDVIPLKRDKALLERSIKEHTPAPGKHEELLEAMQRVQGEGYKIDGRIKFLRKAIADLDLEAGARNTAQSLRKRIKGIDELIARRTKDGTLTDTMEKSLRKTQRELGAELRGLRDVVNDVVQIRRFQNELGMLERQKKVLDKSYADLNDELVQTNKALTDVIPVLENRLARINTDLEAKEIINFPEEMFENSMKILLGDLGRLNDIVKESLGKTSVNYAREVQVTYENLIKDMQDTLVKNYNELRASYSAMKLEDFQDTMVTWKGMLEDMSIALAEKPSLILDKYSVSGKIDSLVKAMYGGDILHMVEGLVEDMSKNLKTQQTKDIIKKIKDTLYVDGKLSKEKLEVISGKDGIVDRLLEPEYTDLDSLIRSLTTDVGDATTMESLYEELSYSLAKIGELDYALYELLEDNISDIGIEKVVEDLYYELVNYKSAINKRLAVESSEELKAIVSTIEEFEDLFEFSVDEVLAYAENAAKTYSLKLNATLRNLHILQNADLSKMLDAISSRNWTEVPALETLNAISNWDTAALRKIKIDMDMGRIDNKILQQLRQLGFDPKTNNVKDIEGDLREALTMIMDAQDAARQMMDTLHGMVSVRQLYADVKTQVDLGMDKGIANHFLDAIQRMYDKPPLLVTAAEEAKYPGILNHRVREIVENVENQLRGEDFKYNVKLNNWRERVRQLVETDKMDPKALEEYDSIFGGTMMEHTAIADSYSEYLIHKYIFKDAEVPGVKSVYIDVEGSGLNTNVSTLYQMSMVIPETDELVWFINKGVKETELPMSDDVYYLLFGDKERAKYTMDEVKEMFRKVYQEGDIDLLKKHFNLDERIKVVVGNDEADMLRKFQTALDGQKPPVGKLQYRIHNGLEYDVPLINNRAKALDVDRSVIDALKVDDTKVRLEDKFGIKRLTHNEIESMENIIFNYLRHRKSEISALMEMRTTEGTSMASKINADVNTGTFLPTMDDQFRTAFDRFQEVFDPANTSRAKKAVDNHYSTTESLVRALNESLGAVDDELKALGIYERELRKMSIDVVESDLDVSKRLLPEDWFNQIPKGTTKAGKEWHLANNNIGADIARMNTVNGVYVPIFGVKRELDSNKAVNYFNTGETKVTTRMLRSMSEMSDDIDRIARRVKSLGNLGDVGITEMHRVQDILLDEIERISGVSLLNPSLRYMKKHDSHVTQFAQLHMLYKKYINVVTSGKTPMVAKELTDGTKLNLPGYIAKEVIPANEELFRYLDKPDLLLNKLGIDYDDPARFHTLGSMSGDAEEVIKAVRTMSELAMDTLQDVTKVQGQLKFTRMQRLMPLYRGMVDTFDQVDKLVDDVTVAIQRGISEGSIPASELKIDYRSRIYNRLRIMMEAPDAILSYQKVKWFMELEPEDMLSFVRHQGKGVVIFKNDSLVLDNYFPMRNGLEVKKNAYMERDLFGVYDKLYKNRKAYENLGLTMNFERGYTSVYIKEADMERLADIKYNKLTQDFDIAEYIDDILETSMYGDQTAIYLRNFGGEDRIKEILQTMVKTRGRLTSMATDGNTSTLEILDEIAMTDILKRTPLRTPGVVSVETMRRYGFFEDNHFNHSILGHIDHRREFMQYASFNPAKTMFHAADMLENQLSTQVQFIELMQTPEYMLKNMTAMTDKEMLDYLKDNPHLKVAFLNGNKEGTDFKLATITLRNTRDIAFAKKMNAVVVDKDVYTTAYSVINRYRLPTRTLRFIDRTLVAPFKIGWLAWNPGVVVRNIFDTDVKSAVALKELTTQRQAAEMFKDWYNYNNAKNAIYKYAREKRVKVEPAIEHYFSQPSPKISRDMFDMIAEYEKAGGEMGKVREAQKYYGEAVDRMYRRIGERESGIDLDQFKELLKMPDDTAELWLKEQLLIPDDSIKLIMDTKGDLLNYKRAYEMHKLYKGQDITVDGFFAYIKSGRIPQEHVEVFERLMHETRGVKAEADLLQKALDHPLISNSMSWNLQSEEVLRLTMYKNLKMKGWSPAEIMAEIERVHFNYDKKNRLQIFLEMIMPFSTFRTNSIIFWSEEMMRNHHLVELVGKTWAATSGFKDRDFDDVLLRRSLRYQMYTGNVILNEETGFTMKLNPSVIDMMNFYGSPVDYMMTSFHSAGRSVYEFLTMQQESWQSDEDFRNMKRYHLLNLLPFVGSHVNRFNSNMYRSDDKAGLAAIKTLFLSPLFNTTWTPAQSDYVEYEQKPWFPVINNGVFYPPYQRRVYNRYPRGGYSGAQQLYYRKTYPQKSYMPQNLLWRDWSNYSTFNRMYYSAQFKFRHGSAYPTKNSRSLNTAFSDMWRRSMTKKGNPKYRFLSFPTNKWTRDLKINILRSITSYYRWQ